MKSKRKCCNCDEEDKDETYYKYGKKIYCYACLEGYYGDELHMMFFDKFLEEECEELK